MVQSAIIACRAVVKEELDKAWKKYCADTGVKAGTNGFKIWAQKPVCEYSKRHNYAVKDWFDAIKAVCGPNVLVGFEGRNCIVGGVMVFLYEAG